MATSLQTASKSQATQILRSVLHRDDRTLSCDVIARGCRSYDVCVVPHWDVSPSVIETFKAASKAVRRHTELSWLFQQAGWERLPSRDLERATQAVA